MDLIDLLIIAALLYAAIRGYRRGLTYSLFSLLGLLLGLEANAKRQNSFRHDSSMRVEVYTPRGNPVKEPYAAILALAGAGDCTKIRGRNLRSQVPYSVRGET